MHALHTLCTLVFLFSALPILAAEMVSVKGTNVNLRSQPSTSSAVKWEYGHGFPLKIVASKGEWAKVSDFENDAGWIHRSLLSDTPYVIVNAFKNSNRSVNIRKEPTTQAEIVGKAYYGVVFQVVDRQKDWVKIRHESGLQGWIFANLLWGL